MRRRHDVRELSRADLPAPAAPGRRRPRAAPANAPDSSASSRAARSTRLPRADVDQNRALLHRSDLRAPEEGPSLLRRRRVQRDDVGAAEELREADERHAHLPRAIGGEKGIVTEEPRLEGARPGRHARAHLAETHDADRLAAKLGAQEFRFLPAAGRHRGGRRRHSAQECQEERECVLDRGHDVGGRSVQNEHAARGRGRDVTLSTPTPARATTWRRGAAARSSASTAVALRTRRASASASAPSSSRATRSTGPGRRVPARAGA
jgi:hypothetical protein